MRCLGVLTKELQVIERQVLFVLVTVRTDKTHTEQSSDLLVREMRLAGTIPEEKDRGHCSFQITARPLRYFDGFRLQPREKPVCVVSIRLRQKVVLHENPDKNDDFRFRELRDSSEDCNAVCEAHNDSEGASCPLREFMAVASDSIALRLRRESQHDIKFGIQFADFGTSQWIEGHGHGVTCFGVADRLVNPVLGIARVSGDVTLCRELVSAGNLYREVDVRCTTRIGNRLDGPEQVLAC